MVETLAFDPSSMVWMTILSLIFLAGPALAALVAVERSWTHAESMRRKSEVIIPPGDRVEHNFPAGWKDIRKSWESHPNADDDERGRAA